MENEASGGREANKICGVCGDRALGFNFNALSCESCKAFFRRNALKNKEFRCPFSQNCNVTPITRRFCQKCRLEKCFSIGMRKEYIMTEEDKVLKRQKIEQNRAKKRSSDEPRGPKMKREVIEDPNYDETSVSVTSIASTVSETYFWESDKKYADLDGNRQQTVESLSPVTAASVPSPSSPPESRDIIGSKTLDMLKESTHSNKNTGECQAMSFLSRENPCSSNSTKINGTISSENYSKYSSIGNNYTDSSASESEANGEKHLLYSHSTKNFRLNNNNNHQFEKTLKEYSNDVMNQSVQDSYTKRTDLISVLTEKSDVVIKLVLSNPQLATKIFQDKDVISKMISDPEIVTMLTGDSQISKLFELYDNEDCCFTSVVTKKIPDKIIENTLESDENSINNPILINLITNGKSVERDSKNYESTVNNSDWSRVSDDVTRDVVQDVQRIPIAVNTIESILCEAIKLEFSAYSALSGNQNSKELNDAERAKLNELIVANKALLAPLDDDITNLVGDECRFKENSEHSDPMLLDVINLTAIAIRRLIKMSKKINAFKNMCQEDQLALLKGGCTEMLILRSTLTYDSDKDMWKIPHSQERMSKIKVDVLKEAKGNLYSEHARFVKTFDPRWRDENIILILSAIALFTPERPRVVHSDVIKLEQNSYYYLLRRYLESIYPGCEARSTFLKLIQKISELHRLNNEVVGVYLNVNPSSVEPLLIEIFDLKH